MADGSEATAARFGIVASRFNQRYVDRMLEGAFGVLERQGVARDAVLVEWVPGSFELPLASRWMVESKPIAPDAILALGVLIRGETEHFRLVAEASAHGLLRVGLDTGVPVLNGILAVADAAQAEARCGGAVGNRGAEVALAALQMAALARRLRP